MRALILAGGSGTRFWPLSRRDRPKQLLALDGSECLLRRTVGRLAPLVRPSDVWICTTASLRPAIRDELPEVPPDQILAEPEGRNTAPAIGWSLDRMPAEVRDDVVAILPADHRVADAEAFRGVLAEAGKWASRGRVVTVGIRPRWPETGYGYLELGAPVGPGVRAVERFTEKPELDVARRWVEAGSHLWNGGIFVARGATLREKLGEHAPEVARGLDRLREEPERLRELYGALPSISIDYAVMERLDDLLTVVLDAGWSDLGSWEALSEVLPADEEGNGARGDAIALDSRNNLLVADEGTIAVLGVEDLVVVRTGDSVLVLPRSRSQEVRRIVECLRSGERSDLL